MKKFLLLTLILLTACTPATVAPTPTAPPPQVSAATFTPAPTRHPTSNAAATPLPTPSEPSGLALTASDGAQFAATFYPPIASPAPGVLLVPMLGGCACRADWDAFARVLQQQGFAALAIDLRGYGDSAKPEDWTKAPGDVRAAWDTLVTRPEVDGKRSALVGASIGANLALIVGANNPDVVTVIALSPGQDFHGLKPAGVLSNFGERPVLFVASQDDGYSYNSVKQLAPLAPQGETYYLANAGHGTQMFRDPSLEPLLLDWLQRYVGTTKG